MSPLRDLYILRIIHFILAYMYVSSLLLSSENICGTSENICGTRQRVNSAPNETQTHSCRLVKCFSGFVSVYIEITVLC